MLSRKIGEINIRFAVPKDISEIISINLKTLPEHYSHSFFIELLIDSPETFLVAELNNKIGFTIYNLQVTFLELINYERCMGQT